MENDESSHKAISTVEMATTKVERTASHGENRMGETVQNMEQAITKPGSWLAAKYNERQLIIVADDIIPQIELLVRQVGATAPRTTNPNDLMATEKQADAIIFQTILQVAAAGAIPMFVNWAVSAGLMGIGIVRIGRVYGDTLTKQEAIKLILHFLRAAGIGYASIFVFVQIFTGVAQTTVIGYPVAAAIEASVMAGLMYALGITAKAYFRGERRKDELGKILRAAHREGKKEFTKENLEKLRQNERPALFDYESLRQTLTSEQGKLDLVQQLSNNPEISKPLFSYMSRNKLADVGQLSAEHLRALDGEAGLAYEIWELLKPARADALGPDANPDAVNAPIALSLHGISLLVVDRTQISGLAFPPGHPRNGTMYVGHPVIAGQYYPMANFHRFLFEHKFVEAIRLLRYLGATRIEVEHLQGKSTGWLASANLDALIGQLGARSETQKQSKSGLLWKASFPSSEKPSLPDDLVWYQGEPGWREIAQARLQHDLQSFELYVRYEDDLGINSRFVGRLKLLDVGLDIGGAFEDHEKTIWRIWGEFGNSERTALSPGSKKAKVTRSPTTMTI